MKRIGLDITVLNTPQRTGIAVYTYELISALLQINHTDEFILFGFSTLSTYDYLSSIDLKKYPNVKIKIIRWPARFFKTTFLLWQSLHFPTIDQLIGPVDIYHSFNYYLPPQNSGKSVATIFDLTSLNFSEFHLSSTTALDEVRFKRIVQKADLTIAISESSKKDFFKKSSNSQVEVIYPGVSELFNSQNITLKTQQKVLAKYNLKPGYFLSVATIEPRKNLTRLMEAYLSTNSSDPLVLVGGVGWKSQEIINLAKKYPKKIIPLGFVDEEDLPTLYKASCCLVYPSIYEGFGLPVLEAMKSGTAVICSNTSSLPEVGGSAVLYVDPLKTDEIATKMIQLKNSPDLRQKLINQGSKQAEKFTWQTSADKLLKLYDSF